MLKKRLPKLLAVVGPTAVGKSDMAIKLAKKFNGELISADSRQIYKGMDIGTAKPAGGRWVNVHGQRAYLVKGIPIFLLDVASVKKIFTVAQYKKLANSVIKKIIQAKKLPILVGGTGLSIKAVLENLLMPQAKPDPKLRKKLETDLKEKGSQYLYKKLLKLDPASKNIVDKQNPRRVIRALEVCLITAKPFSAMRIKGQPLYDSLILGIMMPRKKLYKRIDQRVDKMIKMGLVKEVKDLSKKYSWNSPGLSGLGYKQFEKYFSGQQALEPTVQEIKKMTRRYAKRQLTWFKNQHQVIWIKNQKQAERKINSFLSKSL